jgi:hypothetical protein
MCVSLTQCNVIRELHKHEFKVSLVNSKHPTYSSASREKFSSL